MGRFRMCVTASVSVSAVLGGLGAVPTSRAAAPPAGADRPTVLSVREVAGRSPYVGSRCNVATGYYTSPGGKEGEPFIAVNPRRPGNRIAVWMDATRATVDAAYTTDGGRRWTSSRPWGIDQCTGNRRQRWEASGDPWLSVGPDGVVYLSTLSWAHFVTPPARDYVSVVHVQTSRDGGRSWSAPVFLAGHRAVSDKPMVLADPYRAGVAYEIWRNQSFGLPVGARGATGLLFARTRNAGRTWSAPVRIAAASRSAFFGSPQLSVLHDGTLVATSSLADPRGGTDLLAYRSADGGRSWSERTRIRRASSGAYPAICGQSVAGGDTASSSGQQTVLRGRTVLLINLDGAAAARNRGKVIASWSDDGGRHWRSAVIQRSGDPILLASVAADPRGRIGMVWDSVDLGAVDCVAMTIPTRTRFAASSDGVRAWGRPVVIGPPAWNLASAARGTGGFSGYFLGDYQAIAANRTGWTTVTVQGTPLRPAGSRRPGGQTGVMVANIDR